ncbi:MAG: 30S ribosomal protein S8 [Patescibacteria group bacterium]
MYIDLLTRIKNAQAVKRDSVKAPYSNMDFAVAEVLAANKYIAGAEKKGRTSKRIIEIGLNYKEGRGAIRGVKFVSKPSLRKYVGYRDIRAIKQGYGMMVISTPQGIMTNKDARAKKLGGEVLFEIW